MGLEATLAAQQDVTDVRSQLSDVRPAHPALARLQHALDSRLTPDQAITSYDRMHHRHSRS